jgi:hypothetical protein
MYDPNETVVILSERKADEEKKADQLTPEQQAMLDAAAARKRKQNEVRKRENDNETSKLRRGSGHKRKR